METDLLTIKTKMQSNNLIRGTVLGLGLSLFAVSASADVIGNAAAKQLQQDTLELFTSASSISPQASQKYLKRNHFETESVNWNKNGQVIHGPFYIPDGQEEGEAIPYLFAFNQGKSIVGVGGWIPETLLAKLKSNPTVKCKKISKSTNIWLCAHSSASAVTQQTFTKEILYLAENSN